MMIPSTLAKIRYQVLNLCPCVNFRFRHVTTCFDYVAVNHNYWEWGENKTTDLIKLQAILLDDRCQVSSFIDGHTPHYILLSTKEELEYFKSVSQVSVIMALRESYGKCKSSNIKEYG